MTQATPIHIADKDARDDHIKDFQAVRRTNTVRLQSERPLTAAPVPDTDANETDIPPTWRQRLVQADHLDRARLLAYCSRLFTAMNASPVS